MRMGAAGMSKGPVGTGRAWGKESGKREREVESAG